MNECLADVWELQEYKLMVHQSKMEALREALKAADEQLSQQKSLNTQLELEVRKEEKGIFSILHHFSFLFCRTIDSTPSLELCCIAWTSLKKRSWT